jgi:peroxiredoxin Q/BCP
MIAEGSRAPDFIVQADDGRDAALRDFRGHWVVLYFFPKADTPG